LKNYKQWSSGRKPLNAPLPCRAELAAMFAHNDSEARPDVRVEPQAYDLPSAVPPRLACGVTCARSDILPDIRGGVLPDSQITAHGAFCDHGLSALQINVLALILRAGARVTPYERIARQLAQEFGQVQTAESVRGVVNRLAVRGFVRHRQSREGTLRGVRFSPVDALICPHISPVRADPRCSVRGEARPEPSATPSILKEIDRENTLSISSEKAGQAAANRLEALTEDDLAFHWPELARLGFGTHQIRQILQRLAQVNIGADKITQGLTHAEWELTAGKMRDKNGEPIASPASWVFAILAKQGYYPRPHGYVSPLEQAALDATEEKTRLTEARQAHFEAEYCAWESGLSETERQTILTEHGHQFEPQHITLKKYFRAQILQKTDRAEANYPTAHSKGGGQDA